MHKWKLNGDKKRYQICCGRYSAKLAGVNVDRKCDEGADEGAKLEDGPKDGEGFALVLFKRIAHHDRALSRPQESRGYTEHAAGEN